MELTDIADLKSAEPLNVRGGLSPPFGTNSLMNILEFEIIEGSEDGKHHLIPNGYTVKCTNNKCYPIATYGYSDELRLKLKDYIPPVDKRCSTCFDFRVIIAIETHKAAEAEKAVQEMNCMLAFVGVGTVILMLYVLRNFNFI
jgi:hypothetical protein